MFKKAIGKYLGLTLAAVLMLSACTKAGPTEDPAVVLEKAITQASKMYEAKTTMDMAFTNPDTKESGKVNIIMNEKTNAKDAKNMQSEVAMDVNADIQIKQPETGAETSKKGALGQILVNMAGNFKVSGDDLYASLTKLEIKGDFEGVKEVNAMLPLFVGPYMNETVHLPLDKLSPIMEKANAQLESEGQPAVDYEALKAYGAEGMPKDLADSKMLVVSKDNGLEKVKGLSGESVQAYHYKVALDSKGFETFLKKFNEKTKMIPAEELTQIFAKKEGEPGFAEAMDVVNEAMDIQIWIGQADYHVYKMEIGTDNAKLIAAVDKIRKIDKTANITDEDIKLLKEGKIEFKVMVESSPLKSFSVEKPTDKNIIDLGPMLEMATKGVMEQMPTAGETTDTEMSEEDMQKMMESLNAPATPKNVTAPAAQ